MTSAARCLTLLLAILICFPSEAEARKKPRRSKGSTKRELIEPDALAAKPAFERRMFAAAEARQRIKQNVYSPWREGIDVSRYQGYIDWEEVAGSSLISYAYLKATEGESLVDRTYQRNLSAARRAGLNVGSYHFYRPNIDWRKQFENMTSVVRREKQDLVPIIDIEVRGRVSHRKFLHDLEKFLKAVTKHYGKRPLLYTFQNFYNKHLCHEFNEYPWMIAKYREDEPMLNDGQDFIIWQYTAEGCMPGIEGNVDRSRIMGEYSLDNLRM